MGSYVGWTIAVLLVLAGFVLLLFVPGIGVIAAVGLAFGLVLAAILAINHGGMRAALSSDTEAFRTERVERVRVLRRGGRRADR